MDYFAKLTSLKYYIFPPEACIAFHVFRSSFLSSRNFSSFLHMDLALFLLVYFKGIFKKLMLPLRMGSLDFVFLQKKSI